MNLRIFTVLLLAAVTAPGAVVAQTLRVGNAAPVAADRSLPYAAYPLTALAPLDARLERTARGVRVIIVGDTIDFERGTPFYRHGGKVLQLPFPTQARGEELLVPRSFFVELLPRALSPRLSWAENHLSRTAAPSAPVAARSAAAPPRSEAVVKPVATRTVSNVAPESKAPPKVAPESKAPPKKGLNRVVVIDPGHGGKDPGKPGPNGLLEKNVALSVSNRLAGFLRERGYEVHLTRTRDTLIALNDRPHMANEWKKGRPSVLFVSIHANSAVKSARGFETFFLSDARTDDERRVAEMENEVVKFEERPKVAAPELDLIVSSLKNDYYMRASNDLAATIQQHIAQAHPGPNRGVKRAGFRVLVGALMPSVLVELAFISNPDEAKLLGTSAFQQKMAFSLAEAIGNYFDSYEHLWTSQQQP